MARIPIFPKIDLVGRLMSKAKSQSERVSLGAQAEGSLPGLRQAVMALRMRMLESLAATAINDQAGRERLYLAVQMLPEIERMLIEVIADGQIASAEIDVAKRLAQAEQRPN